MNQETIVLVRGSWQQMMPIRDAVAQLFYGRLFELDPSLHGLFKGDMVEQGRKLMSMINLVVASLDNLVPLLGAVEDLGRRHVDYGVTDAHYDTVGRALLWTLGEGLGKDFTPAVEAAWTEAYANLATVMKQAACAPA